LSSYSSSIIDKRVVDDVSHMLILLAEKGAMGGKLKRKMKRISAACVV
jgi:hypothetical protein